jgi:hypothetical protein
MPFSERPVAIRILSLLILACAVAVVVAPVSGVPLKIRNWSSSPDEIHAGNLTNVTLDVDYTSSSTTNISYIFSTEFLDPEWNYQVWVNDLLVQSGTVQGDNVSSLPPSVSVQQDDHIRLQISLTETAPDVSEKTGIRAVGVMEMLDSGRVGVQTYASMWVYPASFLE